MESQQPTLVSFRPDARGTFVDRPNRFVVRVNIEGRTEAAHCPNPGRLSELLFPGDTVVLERARPDRKLPWTLVAVERPGESGPVTVPLVSVRANPAVGALFLPRLFSPTTLRSEVAVGSSRFDWSGEADGQRHLIEVKACSEVEWGTTLFPDAPSARARKHLEELATWGRQGWVSHVVFAVVHGRPRSWAPNHHTDPGFARTLGALRSSLNLHAVVFETSSQGLTTLVDDHLPIDLSRVDGPDAGLVVRLEPGLPRWSIAVDWYASGWEKAASRVPARRSFAIRSPKNRRNELLEDLGSPEGDPRLDRTFIDTVMRWRHADVE